MFPIKDNIPTSRFPFVTATLILINVVAYLLAIRHGGSLIGGPDDQEVFKYGAIPYAITHHAAHCNIVQVTPPLGVPTVKTICDSRLLAAHGIPTANPLPPWETVFTAMFMHASILHIGGNMLFLWIFGNNVEEAMGRVKYVLFYLAAGVAALALQVAVDPSSTAPTLGASGAIAGVLGGYIVLFPRARVLTVVFIILFFTVLELPALVLLGVWFAEQAVFAATGLTTPAGGGGGVAYFAHVGGFIFGLVTVKLLASPTRLRLPVAI
ncbi:MAG TPA: rhomboid family intramembrane serine protease [Solirubrobacteraceae bacterium]|nr:rhomboid family intramembrane serine protease [Solirubrobacteraceae bacterium]